jgi:hypothetical protein
VTEAGKRAREAYGAMVEMAGAGADSVALNALRRMLKP